jgi:hypothetical protein
LVVDRIPLALLAGLAVGRIPLALSVALADDATASGCCASRHSERARCLTVQQSRRNKAKRNNQMVESEK